MGKGMTSNANLILFLVSHEWATWVRSYMQREMKKGHKVLFRYHGKNIMCRVTEVSNHPSEFGTALYTVQWPVNSYDPKEVKSKKSVPRKYLKFPLPRFPKTWADWLVNELNLYGGQAEVAWRRNRMQQLLQKLPLDDHVHFEGIDGKIHRHGSSISNNCKFIFLPFAWSSDSC